jgi:hypothetical protein
MQLRGHKERIDHLARKLYHTDVYFPTFLAAMTNAAIQKIIRANLTLSLHAEEQILAKDLDYPGLEDVKNGQIIEVEVDNNNFPTKILFRTQKTHYDLCFAVSLTGNIITVYGREKLDRNQTLAKERYVQNASKIR